MSTTAAEAKSAGKEGLERFGGVLKMAGIGIAAFFFIMAVRSCNKNQPASAAIVHHSEQTTTQRSEYPDTPANRLLSIQKQEQARAVLGYVPGELYSGKENSEYDAADEILIPSDGSWSNAGKWYRAQGGFDTQRLWPTCEVEIRAVLLSGNTLGTRDEGILINPTMDKKAHALAIPEWCERIMVRYPNGKAPELKPDEILNPDRIDKVDVFYYKKNVGKK